MRKMSNKVDRELYNRSACTVYLNWSTNTCSTDIRILEISMPYPINFCSRYVCRLLYFNLTLYVIIFSLILLYMKDLNR